MTHAVIDLSTPLGPARLYADVPAEPSAVLVLGHGAGGGVDAPDLVALTALADRGVAVCRFEQPWRTAGKKVAPAPPRLDEGWAPAMAYAAERWPRLPVFVGGRSAGARVACRWAAAHPVAGVVALSFPLHPPGRPDRSRAPELLGARPRVLVLQGERDPFGTPPEFVDALGDRDDPSVRLVVVPDCAHALSPPRRGPLGEADVARLIVAEVEGFVAAE
ncbi:alpha/beta hydrolase family protein [Mariniluteicoccus flavus]